MGSARPKAGRRVTFLVVYAGQMLLVVGVIHTMSYIRKIRPLLGTTMEAVHLTLSPEQIET